MNSPCCCLSLSRHSLSLFFFLLVTTMRNGVIGFLMRNKVQHLRPMILHTTTRRTVSLPTRHGASVTGTVYEAVEANAPVVTLFTKEGCTLCDKVKAVLVDLRESHDHSLLQVDITDESHAEWFDRYKYDIPVCHLNSKYWIKHRLTTEQAQEGFEALKEGRFESPPGQPNASEMERK